ncbi:hypothetical protein JCM16303_002402, partial [Sporobolomyces ruberrimus]
MGKRSKGGTPSKGSATSPSKEPDSPPPRPSSPSLDTSGTETEPETEGEDDSFMDADGPSTATNSDNDEEDESSPHTPTRSRSPVPTSLSTPLATTSIQESTDVLAPLTPTIPSSSTYEKPKRPFSLSSEPDTPTIPSTPSPKKQPTTTTTSPQVVVPISPSLTQQVWRNSMGLPPSPVPAPSSSAASNGNLVEVNLSDSTPTTTTATTDRSDLSSVPKISTTLDYTENPPPSTSSPTNGFKSEAIEAAFARVREQSESEAKANGSNDEEGGGEVVDWDFWGRVMSDYEDVARTQPRELSKAIQRGIPQSLRGMTWQLMAAAKDPTLEMVYQELLHQTSSHEKSISRDLSRTFPKHEYFMDEAGVGQENLFNVVKAYSLYDEEVGYTQGLQFIVGPLLLNMPDEETFCVLVRLMKSYDLRSHYTPNMPGLQLRLFQFDRLVEELLPGIFLHMLRQGVKSSMYASQWFLTLFGYRFPLELVSAVFDLVFAEGVEAIFRFAIALIKRNEDVLLKLEFEDLIEFLKNGLFEVYA